jgi:hypothetical protein
MLAFTDADYLPEPGWLEALAGALGDERQIVAGHIEAFARDLSRPNASERFDVLWGFPQHRFVTEGYGASANLGMPRAVFDEVGLYDASLLSEGDKEWCQRATARGVPIRYEPLAIVRHPARDRLWQHVTKTRRLTGGVFLQSKGRGAKGRGAIWRGRLTILYHSRPPVRRLYEVATTPGLGSFGERLRLAGVLIVLRLVSLVEWVRLEVGGKPERR